MNDAPYICGLEFYIRGKAREDILPDGPLDRIINQKVIEIFSGGAKQTH